MKQKGGIFVGPLPVTYINTSERSSTAKERLEKEEIESRKQNPTDTTVDDDILDTVDINDNDSFLTFRRDETTSAIGLLTVKSLKQLIKNYKGKKLIDPTNRQALNPSLIEWLEKLTIKPTKGPFEFEALIPMEERIVSLVKYSNCFTITTISNHIYTHYIYTDTIEPIFIITDLNEDSIYISDDLKYAVTFNETNVDLWNLNKLNDPKYKPKHLSIDNKVENAFITSDNIPIVHSEGNTFHKWKKSIKTVKGKDTETFTKSIFKKDEFDITDINRYLLSYYQNNTLVLIEKLNSTNLNYYSYEDQKFKNHYKNKYFDTYEGADIHITKRLGKEYPIKLSKDGTLLATHYYSTGIAVVKLDDSSPTVIFAANNIYKIEKRAEINQYIYAYSDVAFSDDNKYLFVLVYNELSIFDISNKILIQVITLSTPDAYKSESIKLLINPKLIYFNNHILISYYKAVFLIKHKEER
jgi:hypothetical protein